MSLPRLLLLEDNADDVELFKERLDVEGFACELTVARRRADYERAIEQPYDLVISDYSIPSYDGLSALALKQLKQPEVPFVFFSGSIGEEQAVKSLRSGAADYILKQNSQRLVAALRRALEDAEVRAQSRRAEAALRKSEERLRIAVKSSAIFVFNQDRDLRYTWVQNQPSAYTPEHMLGKTDEEIFANADATTLGETKRRTIETGVGFRGEMPLKVGPVGLIFDLTVEPLRDAAGVIVGLTGAAIDITERKLFEAQLLRTQRLDTIGALASGVAHDLNNVLAPILLGLEMLELQSDDDSKRGLVSVLRSSALRGKGVVDQILSFARGSDAIRAPIPIAQLISDQEDVCLNTFPKSIRVRQNVDLPLWTVVGDRTQIFQVLMNFCVNARDAMPEGGMLTIEASNVMIDAEVAATHPDANAGPHVLIGVRDSGGGIPPAVLSKIFEPFFTTKEIGKGTGLGLSTVRTIVKAHGGFLTVQSGLGVGTEFKVYLPATPSAGADHAATTKMNTPSGNGELILVVDDEKTMLAIMKGMLELNGYRVLTANDGTEAITRLAQSLDDVAVMITDIFMPFMDGATTIRAARKMKPGLKVIAVSARSDGAQTTQSADEPNVRFLQKPFSAEKLLVDLHDTLCGGPTRA